MVNWDKAPEEAVKLIQTNDEFYWLNKRGKWWDTLAYTWQYNTNDKDDILISTRDGEEELDDTNTSPTKCINCEEVMVENGVCNCCGWIKGEMKYKENN